MSMIDDLGTWVLRKFISAMPEKQVDESGAPIDPSERLRRIWLKEDEYALLISLLLERYEDRGLPELISSRAIRRFKSVQVFIPQRDIETIADALHELLVERRSESTALLENLQWGNKQAEGEWGDRANLTRSMTSLRDAIILQGKIKRGHRT